MFRIDVHQHLWSEPLLAALAVRHSAPRVRRTGTGWRLELAGEPPSIVPGDDAAARGALVRADGLDRALVALSTALGVETLPAAEAEPLLRAQEETAAGLPPQLGAWASVSLGDPHEAAERLGEELAAHRPPAGLCLPAAALGSASAIDRVGPLLETLERAGAPLFVHPGPAAAPADAPAWWLALTDYVAQLHAAWLAFAHAGRAAHPRLRVVFAALAGLAPLHAERLAARGGPSDGARDVLTFFDVSSYGPGAIGAMVEAVGLDRLVYGSDRPVVEPAAVASALGADTWDALTSTNPARLLGSPVAAAA